MKKQIKITTSVDESTFNCLEKMSEETNAPCSEVIRKALRFYSQNRLLPIERCKAYLKFLGNGEHVIMDIDHWFLYLETIQSSENQDAFWARNQEIARSHGEQIRGRIHTAEDILSTMELFNYVTLTKQSEDDFTLLMRSEYSKKFIIVFLEEIFSSLGIKAEIKANFSKITVRVVNQSKAFQ